MTFTTTAGSGSGMVTCTVAANYGPKRQAKIRVGNYAFTVTEDGASNASQAQVPTLSSASLSFGKRSVGAPGAAQPVQLTNTSTSVLSLLAITAGGRTAAISRRPTTAARPWRLGNVARSR